MRKAIIGLIFLYYHYHFYFVLIAADIYAVAYQRIHELDTSIQRNEVVFIDDKEDNIVAARTFGFQGIVYNAKYQPASVLAAALVAHGVTEAAVPVFVTNS